MRAIEDRLLQIETQLPHIAKAAENAARAASTEALNPHLMEIGGRLGRLEQSIVPKLPAPNKPRKRRTAPKKSK